MLPCFTGCSLAITRFFQSIHQGLRYSMLLWGPFGSPGRALPPLGGALGSLGVPWGGLCPPCGDLGAPFGSHGGALAPSGGPLGYLGVPLGGPVPPMGGPLGSLWVPCGGLCPPRGDLWAPSGSHGGGCGPLWGPSGLPWGPLWGACAFPGETFALLLGLLGACTTTTSTTTTTYFEPLRPGTSCCVPVYLPTGESRCFVFRCIWLTLASHVVLWCTGPSLASTGTQNDVTRQSQPDTPEHKTT